MHYISAFLLLPVIFLFYILLNTFRYRKKEIRLIESLPFELSVEIKNKLKEAIAIKTITHSDYTKNDLIQFRKISAFIHKNYPLVSTKLEVKSLNDYSCLIEWPGRDKEKKPVLLISHFDVVPVVEENWSEDPFAAVEKDGYIWGRGTLDTKNTLTAILEAAEQLIGENYIPERSIYLAFGGDEETQGTEGAGVINRYFKERNIEFEWLLDEGGVVAENSLSMVKEPLALVGISEKGYANIRISAEGQGGHSSMPPVHTAAGLVAKAVTVVEKNPSPSKITPTVSAFLKGIVPYVGFPAAMVLANQRIFSPVIKKLLLKSPSTAALIRTTRAVTILSSGTKENVLPSSGEAIVNLRILPGETVDSVLQRMRRLLKKHNVRVDIPVENDCNDPIRESSLSTGGYKLLDGVIQGIFPGSVTVPYMMTGATDSKHYKEVCTDIYRFSPMSLSSDEISLIHSADERISLENYRRAIQFYKTLISKI